jgi:hypothetical protein
MKNSDDAIERVLTGLREAEAPIGMERRILEAMQDRVSVRSARLPLWAWGGAFACTAAVCVAISMIYRIEQVPIQSNLRPVSAGMLPIGSEAAVKSELPLLSQPIVGVKANVKRAKVARGKDSVTLREMQTASFPAPPMPLTDQEKLLLRVAHRGDPEELAMLNNEMRAKQEAEGKTEFQKFFEPSTTGDNE